MKRRLKEPFGKAGLTVAILALVLAMLGGAYAATGSSGGKATASKAKRGPRGPKGATGPAGPQGPAGPAGASGKDGANGEKGATGATGATGPQGSIGNPGSQGPIGNTGPQGPAGSPWTAGGTLPSGATETGSWGFSGTQTQEFKKSDESLAKAGTTVDIGLGEQDQFVPISFSIPLSGKLDVAHTIYVPVGDTSTAHCSAAPVNGTAGNPKAQSGYLCVYEFLVNNAEPSSALGTPFIPPGGALATDGAVPSGTVLSMKVPAEGPTYGIGSWAVTG